MSDTNLAAPVEQTDGPRGADQFIRDDRAEKVLVDSDVMFEFRTVDLTDIDLSAFDLGASPERQMRDEVVHHDVAVRYASDLDYGSRFPAGVLSSVPNDKLRIVDFHHRLWGARSAGLTQVSAYVIPYLEDFDLIELGNILNRNHGVPLAESERIRQALWGLKINRFKTVRNAARVLGIPEAKLGQAKKLEETVERVEFMGLPKGGFEKLPKQAQVRLGSIDSPDVFKQAALSAISKGLGATQVNELVTAVNDAGGDVAKLDVVREYAADIVPRPQGGALSDPYNRLHTACRSVLSVELDTLARTAVNRNWDALNSLNNELSEVSDYVEAASQRLEILMQTADRDVDNVA